MAGRFSHLDFDELPERPKTQPKAPAPLTGITWNPRLGPLSRPDPSRIDVPLGRGQFAYFEPPSDFYFGGPSEQMPMINPKYIEFDISTRDETAFDSLHVRLGVRSNPGVWDYQQIALTYDVVRDLSFEAPIMRKVFAPGYAIVVAVAPRTRQRVCAYVESGC